MNNFKLAIIGNGQLGSYLYKNLSDHYSNIKVYCRSNGYDICNKEKLKEIINENNIIINCAAFTNVDKAETEKQECRKVNCDAVKNIVKLILKKNDNTKFIHISTDYVYGNVKNIIPIKEDTICKPINYYGKTKLYADKFILKNLEKNFLILRPSWLFGPGGNNFIDKLISIIESNNEIKIVDDQFGKITSTYLVLKVINEYLKGYIKDGLYNICCGDDPLCEDPSRIDICLQIIKKLGKEIKIIPCKTKDFKSPAKRQLNSLLDCSKLDNELKSRISRTSWDIELSNYIEYKIKKEIKNV